MSKSQTPKPTAKPNMYLVELKVEEIKEYLHLHYHAIDEFSPSEILPQLYMGCYYIATNQNILTAHGITHILNVAVGECPVDHISDYTTNFVFCGLDIYDKQSEDIVKHFNKAFEFIESALASKNAKILVRFQ